MTIEVAGAGSGSQRKPVLLLTTAANREEAEQLGSLLVEEGLAACVNLVPALHSIYRWQGVVETASEVLLLIKTTADVLEDLERAIIANHSYQVPELLVIPIQSGSQAYLDWLVSSVR